MIPYRREVSSVAEYAMALTRCPQCSADVPHDARFCRRCGRATGDGIPVVPGDLQKAEVPPPVAARAPGALPSTSRMPLAGMLFLAAAVLGPTMIAVGLATGSVVLLVAGIGVAVMLIALLLVGMVF